MQERIHLGYEVGTGEPVGVPLRHMVVTGQTQEAGKTTALEALITRSAHKAITFVTKRGEGGFTGARRIAPYFSERADWQYVASILEASRGEKLKFERAWIIRASKGADTLAQVQRNVRASLEKAKGLSADVYLTLDAYLDAVVPQIEATRWASTVDLLPGLNVMDLTGVVPEMQHLVIRSTIEWVLNHAERTLVVVPEAWKFIPQGRGTPVKLAAESFIRQAAGLKNYLWLDSQDIAGVEKLILKSVPVWVLGVQREFNEIKRTLDQIPAGIKRPRPQDVATLGLGQFYVCHGTTITKTYVQPAWMAEDDARRIALGEKTTTDITPPQAAEAAPAELPKKEKPVMSDSTDKKLDALIELMSRQLAPAAPASPARTATPAPAGDDELYERLKARLMREVPGLVKVLDARPELVVEVERPVVEVDGKSLKGRVGKLIAGGFFKSPRRHNEVTKELDRTGPGVNSGNTATVLKDYVKMGFLTVEEEGYQAVDGMKANIRNR